MLLTAPPLRSPQPPVRGSRPGTLPHPRRCRGKPRPISSKDSPLLLQRSTHKCIYIYIYELHIHMSCMYVYINQLHIIDRPFRSAASYRSREESSSSRRRDMCSMRTLPNEKGIETSSENRSKMPLAPAASPSSRKHLSNASRAFCEKQKEGDE